MIYSVCGEVTHIEPNLVVVECAGVGYACRSTSSAVAAANIGKKIKLYTYLNIREDVAELFGFADETELNCFKKLISVSGIGCKTAIGVLSELSPQEFALAVINEDHKKLTKAPGIGSKAAQRIVLELRDKLKKDSSFETVELPQVNTGSVQGNAYGEAMTALMVLGFSNSQAKTALDGLPPDMSVQELIKEALKRLSGK